MIEADYTLDVAASVDRVWRYVEVIPNWAPFMIGFQKVDLVDDRRSIWTLRGDVGVLAREVQLQADITAWEPPHRAEFTITGLTERITGTGWFTLAQATGEPATVPQRPPWWRRLRFALARALLRRVARRAPPAEAGGAATGGGQRSRLAFHLEVAPGGPMAPMVELLMRPLVEPAAQDFLREIQQAVAAEGGGDERAD